MCEINASGIVTAGQRRVIDNRIAIFAMRYPARIVRGSYKLIQWWKWRMIESLPIAMALLNRWRGHASKYKRYFPRPWSQLALALPFGYIAYRYGALPDIVPHQEYVTWLVVTLLTWATWVTGWGNVYDLGHAKRGEKLEKIEYPIHWLYGRIPEYWYDFIGMALRGAIITIPAGIALLNPLFALSGAGMAVCYAIGWVINDYAITHGKTERRVSWNGINTYLAIRFLPRHLDEATAIGELLTGAFLGAVLLGI